MTDKERAREPTSMDPAAIREHASRIFKRMKSTPDGEKRNRLAEQYNQMSDKAHFADGWNAALLAAAAIRKGGEGG